MITPSYAIDTLLVHSTFDPIVNSAQAENFAQQIEEDTQAELTFLLDDELFPIVAHNIVYFMEPAFFFPDREAFWAFINSKLLD